MIWCLMSVSLNQVLTQDGYTLDTHSQTSKHGYGHMDKSWLSPEMFYRLVERHDAENHVGFAISVDAVHSSHSGAQSLLRRCDHHRDLLPGADFTLRKESIFKGQDRTRGCV